MRRTSRRGVACCLALWAVGSGSCDSGTEPAIDSGRLPSDLVDNMERRYMSSVLADLDGDGDPDPFVANLDHENGPYLLINDGAGEFSVQR